MPYGSAARTVNPVFLNGDFSLEFWFKYSQDGTIIRQGSGFDMLKLSINGSGQMAVSVSGSIFTSKEQLPKDTWIFVAMGYDAAAMTFSMIGQYDTTSLLLFDRQPVEFSPVIAQNHADDNHLYLGGGITGAIHGLALYSICRDVHDAAATKYQAKDNYVYGLTNYWPMNEGHGMVAADTRHTHDFEVNNRWLIDNVNYSLSLEPASAPDGSSQSEASQGPSVPVGATIDISRINTSQGDSYAIELWSQASTNACTVFETGSTESNRLRLRYDDQLDLWLDYGEKSQIVASHDNFPSNYGWHHLALNAVRGQAASFYYDGKRTAVIAEADVPPMQGAAMKIGEGNSGRIDELRIWHAALTESRLLANQYNCIDTTDVYSRGLVAYYPFEKTDVVDGITTKVPTLEDMAPAATSGNALDGFSAKALTTFAPPLKAAPVESRLMARPVASERKVVIELQEGSGIKTRDIEGTTLNITVDQIHDMHGNASLPIRWQTFVQQNTLKWTKDSVNIFKNYGDSYTFDINIENRGGSTEYYTLAYMPEWLSLVDALDGFPVETTGDVAPLSAKTLRFQVSTLVHIGNYDLTIGLQGNNEILEPLRIVMKVRGEMPAWTVDPKKYENNMSVVGQIYIDGNLVSNSESRLAAFINGECRGIAAPKLIRGAAYVPLTVYGTAYQEINGQTADLDRGQPVTFRIWDASTGITYTNANVAIPSEFSAPPATTPDESSSGITFDPNVNYGSFDTPVVFTKSKYVEQPLNLTENWNWLSLGVEPVNPKTSAVFRELTPWNVRIKDQATGLAYCNGAYWAGNLKQIHANTMYKMLITPAQAETTPATLPQPLTVVGEPVNRAETPVTLAGEWNWIAYLPTMTMALGQALAGANPQPGEQVKSQTAFAFYSRGGWEGDLEAMESGKGYLYQTTDPQERMFVYPNVTQSTQSRLSAQSRRTCEASTDSVTSVFNPTAPTDYPDNMSMVIMLTAQGQPVADAQVAAFVDGECRGTAIADNDDEGHLQSPLYYLLIAGEGSGQPMEIRAAVGGEVLTLRNTLTYTADGNIGTPWEPYVINISDLTGITPIHGSTNDGVWYTLQGIRIGTTKPTAPGIYLCNGQKVVIE